MTVFSFFAKQAFYTRHFKQTRLNVSSKGLTASRQIHPSVASTLPDCGASRTEGRGREIPGADSTSPIAKFRISAKARSSITPKLLLLRVSEKKKVYMSIKASHSNNILKRRRQSKEKASHCLDILCAHVAMLTRAFKLLRQGY